MKKHWEKIQAESTAGGSPVWKELALIQLYHAGKVAGAEWKWGVRKEDRIGGGIGLRSSDLHGKCSAG